MQYKWSKKTIVHYFQKLSLVFKNVYKWFRIYLNKTIQILDKINVSHHEYTFIRQCTCWQVYELMSDFCSDNYVDFFNQLFEKMRFMKKIFLTVSLLKIIRLIDLTI